LFFLISARHLAVRKSTNSLLPSSGRSIMQ
jgi:hypothetical protein